MLDSEYDRFAYQLNVIAKTLQRAPARRKGILSIVAASVAFLIWQPHLAHAQDIDDRIGKSLGCPDDPSSSPYCTEPELRILAYEAIRFQEFLDQRNANTSSNTQTANIRAATLRSAQNQLIVKINSRTCRNDVECIRVALADGIREMYAVASLPRPVPLTEQEIAIYSDRERFTIEGRPALMEAIRAMDEAYLREWTEAQTLLSGKPLSNFRLSNRDPEQWVSSWRRCGENIDCHERKAESLAAMIADRDLRYTEQQAQLQEIARREKNERHEALAAEAEIMRREAEKLANEALYARQVIAAQELARKKFPPESMLLHIIQDDFQQADRVARQIATELFDADFASTVRLLAPAMADQMRSAAINNRRNLTIGAYALTRYQDLGSCGDRVITITKQRSDRQVTRNAYNAIISDIPAQYLRIESPEGFAHFVENTHFHRGGRYFRIEVEAIGECDTDLRRILERKILEFAYWARRQ